MQICFFFADFEYSHDKHVFGKDWKSRVRDKEDLRITAYHEAGHTLVAYYTPKSTPLHKVILALFKLFGFVLTIESSR